MSLPVEQDLRAFLKGKADALSDKPYLFFGDETVSYRELDGRSNRVANGVMALGVRPGERVGVMLPNVPDFLYTWFGLAKVGAVMVPLNTAFTGREARYPLLHSEATALVLDEAHLDVFSGEGLSHLPRSPFRR